MRFEYPLLEALAAVVREGTFDAAARSLNITQSAVSQRVKLLEDRMGAVLIRRGRPCVPTEHGQKLYRHIEQVQILEHDLEKSLLSIDASRIGLPAAVRIAVNGDSLATWFPEVMRRASGRLNIFFDLIPDDQEHTGERLRNGEVLAAVTTESNPIQGCRRLALGSMAYIAVATPKFVEEHFPDGVTPEALAEAPVIEYDRKDTIQQAWLLKAFERPIALRSHFVPSFPGYLACCLGGCGWGLVPSPTVDSYLKSGALVELVPGKAVVVALYWQSSVRGSEVMRDLASIVFDVSKNHLVPDSDESY